MAAAAVVRNTAPSPPSHTSAASSPESQSSHLPQQPNTPLYTQEDVIRFVQAALAAACRDQAIHANARPPNLQPLIEERVMKPRVHMYETFGAKRMMITTLELPGLQKDDVHITARPNGDLVISGERRPQHLLYLSHLREINEDEMHCEGKIDELGRTVFNELKFGKFQRVIRLPTGTDPTSINASMDDGMLTITWPITSNARSSEQQMSKDSITPDAEMSDMERKHAAL